MVTKHNIDLKFVCETVTIWIEARQFPKLSSELIFAESVLKKIQLSPLAYGIERNNKLVT